MPGKKAEVSLSVSAPERPGASPRSARPASARAKSPGGQLVASRGVSPANSPGASPRKIASPSAALQNIMAGPRAARVKVEQEAERQTVVTEEQAARPAIPAEEQEARAVLYAAAGATPPPPPAEVWGVFSVPLVDGSQPPVGFSVEYPGAWEVGSGGAGAYYITDGALVTANLSVEPAATSAFADPAAYAANEKVDVVSGMEEQGLEYYSDDDGEEDDDEDGAAMKAALKEFTQWRLHAGPPGETEEDEPQGMDMWSATCLRAGLFCTFQLGFACSGGSDAACEALDRCHRIAASLSVTPSAPT